MRGVISIDCFKNLEARLMLYDFSIGNYIPITDQVIGGKLHSRKYNIKIQGELDNGIVAFPEINNDNPFFINLLRKS